MHRIDNITAIDTPPTPSPIGTNPNGYFDRTTISVDFLNSLQGEISHVIEEAGLTLDKANTSQLLEAIEQIVLDAGVIVPDGGAGDILNVNDYDILSSTGDVDIDADVNDLIINANNVYGSGTLGDGTILKLGTDELHAFFNSTSNYLDWSVAWPQSSATQKLITNAVLHYWQNAPMQYIYGALDFPGGATTDDPYAWDLGSQQGDEYSSVLPDFPFSFALSPPFMFQVASFDVWINEQEHAAPFTFQLWVPDGSGLNPLAVTIPIDAASNSASITNPEHNFRVITDATDFNIGMTMYYEGLEAVRLSYRIGLRLIPL
jgi:hypothetical protein